MSVPSASDALRFWPEQNPRPSPVSTNARIPGSLVISSIATASPPSRSGVIAFRLAGSLSVSRPTAPSRVRFTPAIFLSPAYVSITLNVPFSARHANSTHPNLEDSEDNSMSDQFSNAQQIRKPAVASKGGIVAAQSRKAAETGAEVLAAGGDCVDAVIATTFALGVLEPWMSGVGGGGAMVLYRAREDRTEVIDYGMRAPGSLRVEDYPLTGDGAASDLFPWARVKDDRNLHGPGSIAVPGVVAGMEEAHRRHAKLPWKELLAPSVALAGEGLGVDWWTTLMIASSAADLRRYPASATAYLQDGLPPNAPWGIKPSVRLPQDRLKATLSYLAGAGPRDFYEGDLAKSLAADIQSAGGVLSVEDLAPFRAHLREPLAIPYRGG